MKQNFADNCEKTVTPLTRNEPQPEIFPQEVSEVSDSAELAVRPLTVMPDAHPGQHRLGHRYNIPIIRGYAEAATRLECLVKLRLAGWK